MEQIVTLPLRIAWALTAPARLGVKLGLRLLQDHASDPERQTRRPARADASAARSGRRVAVPDPAAPVVRNGAAGDPSPPVGPRPPVPPVPPPSTPPRPVAPGGPPPSAPRPPAAPPGPSAPTTARPRRAAPAEPEPPAPVVADTTGATAPPRRPITRTRTRASSAPPRPRPETGDAPEQPAPPAAPPSPRHIDTEDTTVLSIAESGAEEGPGAELHVDPPWEGYDQMKAAEILQRLRTADPATKALVALYESSHRRRSTVMNAVG
jgi:hypothetical protein